MGTLKLIVTHYNGPLHTTHEVTPNTAAFEALLEAGMNYDKVLSLGYHLFNPKDSDSIEEVIEVTFERGMA